LPDGRVTLRSGRSSTGTSDVGNESVSVAQPALVGAWDAPAWADSKLPPDASPFQGLGTTQRAPFSPARPGQAGWGRLSRADRHRHAQRGDADACLSVAKSDSKNAHTASDRDLTLLITHDETVEQVKLAAADHLATLTFEVAPGGTLVAVTSPGWEHPETELLLLRH